MPKCLLDEMSISRAVCQPNSPLAVQSVRRNARWAICPFDELSVRQTVRLAGCLLAELSVRRNVCLANCPFGETSVRRALHQARCPLGVVSVTRTVRMTNCPFGELSVGRTVCITYACDGSFIFIFFVISQDQEISVSIYSTTVFTFVGIMNGPPTTFPTLISYVNDDFLH